MSFQSEAQLRGVCISVLRRLTCARHGATYRHQAATYHNSGTGMLASIAFLPGALRRHIHANKAKKHPAGADDAWLCEVSVAGGVQNARKAGKSMAITTG